MTMDFANDDGTAEPSTVATPAGDGVDGAERHACPLVSFAVWRACDRKADPRAEFAKKHLQDELNALLHLPVRVLVQFYQ